MGKIPFNQRPKLRRRVSEQQARDIQGLAKATEQAHNRNVALEAMYAKLNRIWNAGIEDIGREETGRELRRRVCVLMAIVGPGEEYPDVRVVIDQMPEPATTIQGVQ